MHDYKGCLHVHSTYSDGHATVPEILDAARDARLDYVVLTDHATLGARDDGLAGWHNGVLLDVGAELEAGGHHCLALGLEDLSGVARPEGMGATFASISARGGLAFVVHPHPVHKPLFDVWVPGWTDWGMDGYAGLEVWPYMHDWIRHLHPWNLFSHCRDPDRWVRGPEPDILGRWDAVGKKRRVVGIGSLDNHAKRIPFKRWGPALLEVLPHRATFCTVRTHVVSEQPFSGDAAADTRLLHRLLAQGQCYFSYDLLADASGFHFEAQQGTVTLRMGSETAAGKDVTFRVSCPFPACIRLLRDGEAIAVVQGQELGVTANSPGVYRVEATLGGRPWIFSNPIYLR